MKYLRMVLLMLGDFVSSFGSFMLVAVIYRYNGGDYELSTYLAMWPFGLLFILINEISKLYHGTLFYPGATFGPAEELRRIFYSVTSVFCGLLLFIFINKSSASYSRTVFIFSWPLAIFSVVSCRWLLRDMFNRYNFGYVRAIILGAGNAGSKTARILIKNKYLGINPVALLDDNSILHGTEIENITVKGSLNKLTSISEELNADYIIVCLPMTIVMQKIKTHCKGFKHIMIIPSGSMFSTLWVYAYDIGGILGLEMRCNLMLKWPLLLKKITDFSLSLLFTLILMPLMLFCAIIIKCTSRGPVIYKAQRLGLHGKTFYVYKFRTMKIESDGDFEQYLENNPEAKNEWLKNFKLKKDPRITWVGRLLRRTSLDELPQMFNILKGEMSLIGPRPIVEKEKKLYADKFEMISSVKPGVTGLWQVSGRNELDYEERVELDCYYLMNWNIWLDIFILVKTVKEVLSCKGAY
jgi:Undecaprenyl-phosphate galactose phosphotransferase WbaP